MVMARGLNNKTLFVPWVQMTQSCLFFNKSLSMLCVEGLDRNVCERRGCSGSFHYCQHENKCDAPLISSEFFPFGLCDSVTGCHRCSIGLLFGTACANRFVLLWSMKQQRQVGLYLHIRDVPTCQ